MLQPNVRAASSIFGSRFSNAPRALRYISGNATTTAASTVACQLNISGKPMSMNHCPTAVFLPNASSSRKPHTVGGSTMGMVKMESAISCARAGMRRLKYAAKSPRTKMNTIAVSVVFSVTHKGL